MTNHDPELLPAPQPALAHAPPPPATEVIPSWFLEHSDALAAALTSHEVIAPGSSNEPAIVRLSVSGAVRWIRLLQPLNSGYPQGFPTTGKAVLQLGAPLDLSRSLSLDWVGLLRVKANGKRSLVAEVIRGADLDPSALVHARQLSLEGVRADLIAAQFSGGPGAVDFAAFHLRTALPEDEHEPFLRLLSASAELNDEVLHLRATFRSDAGRFVPGVFVDVLAGAITLQRAELVLANDEYQLVTTVPCSSQAAGLGLSLVAVGVAGHWRLSPIPLPAADAPPSSPATVPASLTRAVAIRG